ncbi:MAG: TIGR04255 family protein [Nitrospirae bacterium]|nr:TIGR04255 family protein [Nitrospirota bacterium]
MAVEREIFPNAPITEALLDVRANLPTGTSIETLAAYHDSIRARYPLKRERQRWQVGHEFRPAGPPSILGPTGGPDGYIFESQDKKQAVQARLDGFTFNRLKPYHQWESLREEAMDLWGQYVELAKPTAITRLALRYINRIEIPLPAVDLKEYILTGPEVARGLPQGLANFFMRVMIPSPDSRATALVTLTMEVPTTVEGPLPFIFDIDVFHEESMVPGSGGMPKVLENLHEFKNNIFFGSITDKCKKLFR